MIQTNKHVLSNCSASGPLSRYTIRHNSILTILTEYLTSALPSSSTIYADLPNKKPINLIFKTLRPDLVIRSDHRLTVIELTVCHETNFKSAKERKTSKYGNLSDNLNSDFTKLVVNVVTVEISVLGFITGLNLVCNELKIKKFPDTVLNKITLTAIDYLSKIYSNRNVPDEDI